MTTTSNSVLDLRNLTKRYGAVTAVDHLNLTIRPGEVFTLLGPSGCGKSTTLRMVAGLEEPDEGQILLNDRLIVAAEQGLCLPPERRNMGMVFQSYAIWPHMTVFENVAFPLRLRPWSREQIRKRVSEVLEVVDLGGLEDRPATKLSGGQQQRVALARALSYNPEILLLDEPLSNLDAKLREQMRVEIRTIQRRLKIAVLFVTHDQAEALTLSDRVAVMKDGRVEQVGTPSELYERPAAAFVRDFLGRVLTFEGAVDRSGGVATVALIGGDDATLSLDTGVLNEFEHGARVLITCRPEDIQLASATASAPNRLRALVEDSAYLGERIEYRVRTEGGRAYQVFSSRRSRYAIGSKLDLVIDTRDATVWPH